MSEFRPVSIPRLAPTSADVDVAIVGAGAAGIAAARRCLAFGLTCTVLEARSHVGGRCVTVDVGGHAVDLGAHWLHAGSMNPLVDLGLANGEPLSRARQVGTMHLDGAPAGDRAMREYRAAFEAAGSAIEDAARRTSDPSIAAVLPDLGRWNQPLTATFSLISGRPVEEVSAWDFPAEEFGDNWFVRGGYGAFLARLAEELPITLDALVETVDWSEEGVVLAGPRGRVRARAAIVTVPVAVLAASSIRFTPSLPEPTREALAAFLPGTYEHVLLDWPGSPFGEPDSLNKIIGREASYGVMSRVDESPIHYLELDHATVEAHHRDEKALATFARDWLASELGGDAVRDLRVRGVTDWYRDPWSRSAWAVAKPGRKDDRATLAEPVGERIWFAGEATSRKLWGTVGGAWEEAETAVRAIAERRRDSVKRPVQNSV